MATAALICVAFCFVFAQGFRLSPKSPLNCLWSGTAVSSKCHSQMFSSVRPELNPGQITSRDIISYVSGAFGVALATAVFIKPPPAMASDVIESTYRDYANGFSLLVEPGWSIMPRKTPTPTMLQFQSEEVLFTGSRFNEDGGASSLSVTRSNAARLLKDFEIEWWFAPLKKMADLGSAELVAGLLILQRQGEFEKRESPSSVNNAKIVDDILTFDFTTPLGSIYVRRTDVKAYLRDGKLIVVWISALTTFWEGEYGQKLGLIKDSFRLEDVERKPAV